MSRRSTWLDRVRGLAPRAGRSPGASRPADPVTDQRPEPLTSQRVGDDLTRRGYRFRIDSDGDVTGTWDGNRFWFLLLGDHEEILQIRGRWSGAAPRPTRLAVLQAVNDWNRERIWPKVYAREEGDGLALYAEVSVDFEHGATDDQLAATITCGLATASQFFGSLAALAPPDAA
ncbi:YbjN domain-containing protein [Xylanimonas ulmi]|uniref:Putative sensory transduction regulator n=1 Tax=Xylanimonas ulmi TaxID=228973 RepID=A0A4V2EY07_9MICO|nr:YbjN domain-containing protein [Xylanibacterium ulmi]RZS61330.1 putative sensory transduction regulator [Xylanibacterium ulmi]